jgi:hypothetical protein
MAPFAAQLTPFLVAPVVPPLVLLARLGPAMRGRGDIGKLSVDMASLLIYMVIVHTVRLASRNLESRLGQRHKSKTDDGCKYEAHLEF